MYTNRYPLGATVRINLSNNREARGMIMSAQFLSRSASIVAYSVELESGARMNVYEDEIAGQIIEART